MSIRKGKEMHNKFAAIIRLLLPCFHAKIQILTQATIPPRFNEARGDVVIQFALNLLFGFLIAYSATLTITTQSISVIATTSLA